MYMWELQNSKLVWYQFQISMSQQTNEKNKTQKMLIYLTRMKWKYATKKKQTYNWIWIGKWTENEIVAGVVKKKLIYFFFRNKKKIEQYLKYKIGDGIWKGSEINQNSWSTYTHAYTRIRNLPSHQQWC